MRGFLLAAVSAAAIAVPAAARDGALYGGIEGGVALGSKTKVDLTVTDGADVVEYDNAFRLKYKKPGIDADAVLGYDFGPVRVEGELGYKRLTIDEVAISPALLADLQDGADNGQQALVVIDPDEFDL